MEIHIINPTITSHWNEITSRNYSNAARPGTNIKVVSLDWGTASIESFLDEALVIPNILSRVIQAEEEGADAVIIDCMADPGLYAARELVSIPVVGPAQASMHLAAILGHRFSVLAVGERDIPAVEDQATLYGLINRLASVRAFNVPVLDLEKNIDAVLRVIIDLAEKVVREDDAHVVIPGCTGLAGLASRLQTGLAERGCEVPVLDPPSVALKLVESLVDLGQSHSKKTFQHPPAKKILWPTETVFVA